MAEAFHVSLGWLLNLRLPDLLLIGLFIRLLVAPFTKHPYDLELVNTFGVTTFDLGLNPWKFKLHYGYMWWNTILAIYPFYLIISTIFQSVLVENLFLKIPTISADMLVSLILYYIVNDLNSE